MPRRRHDSNGLFDIRIGLLNSGSGLSGAMRRLLSLDKIGEAVEYGGRLTRPSISIIFDAVRKVGWNLCFGLVSPRVIKGPIMFGLQRKRPLKRSTDVLLTGIIGPTKLKIRRNG